MYIEVHPGQSVALGIVEYVTVHNIAGAVTRFELIDSLVRQLEIEPYQTRTYPTGSGGQQVSFKNNGPDTLLVEPVRPMQGLAAKK